jgi:hypothetical protein
LGLPIDDPRRATLLREYFLATDAAARHSAADAICEIPGLTCAKLAAAIRRVQLWEKQRTGEYDLWVCLGHDGSAQKQVWLSIPKEYDPARRWPLIVAFHGQSGQARQMLAFTRRLLGQRTDEFIIAAPQDIGPLGLTQPDSDVSQPRVLLARLRRIFHIDSDRVYVTGYSLGSHNAWIAAVMHVDCFAGAMPLATPLQMVGGDALYSEILPNARQIAILFCWGETDNLDAQGQPHPQGGNAALNRRMADVIRGIGFPRFEAVELPGAGHLGVEPPSEALAKLLDERRVRSPKGIHQAFRLPEQSRAYWLAANGMQGDPLPNETVQFRVPHGQDPIAAQKKYLVDRLGVIEATCERQTIKLKARRAKNIVLLLGDGLVNFDKPVTIIRNGRKRFEGRIQPDPRVMLDEATREWDFERLAWARVMVPLSGNVRVNSTPRTAPAPTRDGR